MGSDCSEILNTYIDSCLQNKLDITEVRDLNVLLTKDYPELSPVCESEISLDFCWVTRVLRVLTREWRLRRVWSPGLTLASVGLRHERSVVWSQGNSVRDKVPGQEHHHQPQIETSDVISDGSEAYSDHL